MNIRFYNFLVSSFHFTNSWRCWLLRRCGIEIGRGCYISSSVTFQGKGALTIGNCCSIAQGTRIEFSGRIKIGDDTEIGSNVLIRASGDILIGSHCEIREYSIISANLNSFVNINDYCRIAHQVSIKTATHQISLEGPGIAGVTAPLPISVQQGCWICAGAIILPGVTLAPRTVVGAGSVVTKNSIPCSLIAGVPAKTKKMYTKTDSI